MKWLPIFLAGILLLPLTRMCQDWASCAISQLTEVAAAHPAPESHTCCQLPVSEEFPTPADEESPCHEGCDCYCAAFVYMQVTNTTLDDPSTIIQREVNVATKVYSHLYAHPVWQPPQLS